MDILCFNHNNFIFFGDFNADVKTFDEANDQL